MSYVISVSEMDRKTRLGKKEKAILDFLIRNNGTVWQEQILERFTWASRYTSILIKRLYRMQEKGLLEIRQEINPLTGRTKRRVYLKQ